MTQVNLFTKQKQTYRENRLVGAKEEGVGRRKCSARSPSPQSGKKTPQNNATCNRGIYY